MKYFIGVDMGTQSMKGLLLTPEGKVIAEASTEYLPDYPRPGWAEVNPAVWIKALKEVVDGLKSASGVTANEIGAISMDTINCSAIAIDRDCNALGNAIIWLDRRSEPQCEELMSKITNEQVLPIVGSVMASSYNITKWMWIKDNQRDIYDKAYKLCEVSAFMTGYLTGEPIVDYGNASITLAYDVQKREWSDTILNAAGIDKDKMTEVRPATQFAGTLRPGVAKELGLSPSTKVNVCSGDHHVGMIGSGLVKPGMVLDIAGTAEIVAAFQDKPAFDETGILGTRICTLGTYWTLEQGCIVSGGSTRWHKDTVARCSYEQMDGAAMNIAPGSDGVLFLPYLQGAATPRDIGYARGVYFGLTMNHDVSHMTHAVYEGCTFALRDCIERMDAMGAGSDVIICSGGGTKSRLWTQMKADATGKPVQTVKTYNSTPLGAAILAGLAQGNFESVEQALDIHIVKDTVYEPDVSKKAGYDEAYAFYRECVDAFDDPFRHYNI